MKRLNLNETWKQCLAMWKWISRQCLGKDSKWMYSHLVELKEQWLEANGFEKDSVASDCFFCEYDDKRGSLSINDGCFCPARKVDENWDCMERDHCYHSKPRLFYAELKRLNKIRLSKK